MKDRTQVLEEGEGGGPLEINSGKCEIIRALNFDEDFFFFF